MRDIVSFLCAFEATRTCMGLFATRIPPPLLGPEFLSLIWGMGKRLGASEMEKLTLCVPL